MKFATFVLVVRAADTSNSSLQNCNSVINGCTVYMLQCIIHTHKHKHTQNEAKRNKSDEGEPIQYYIPIELHSIRFVVGVAVAVVAFIH